MIVNIDLVNNILSYYYRCFKEQTIIGGDSIFDCINTGVQLRFEWQDLFESAPVAEIEVRCH